MLAERRTFNLEDHMKKLRHLLVAGVSVILVFGSVALVFRSGGDGREARSVAQERGSADVFKWRLASDDGANSVYRAKVPGGWLVLVRCVPSSSYRGEGAGITFMPDPEHKWDGATLK
jgi:hypothetical protein